jgi:hypothetical protein
MLTEIICNGVVISFLFIDHSVAIFFLVKKMYNLVLFYYEEYCLKRRAQNML